MDCSRITGEEVADRYLSGRLSEEDREAYESHYFLCSRCFDELKMLQALQAELQQAPALARPEIPRPLHHRPWVWAAAAAGLAVPFVLWGGAQLVAPTTEPSRTSVVLKAPQLPAAEDGGARVAARVAELAKVDPPEYLPLTLRSDEEARIRFDAAMAAYAKRDYQTAATGLEQVIAVQPSNARALFFLGISSLMLDRIDPAVAALERSAALRDPAYSDEARYFLAKALLRKGDRGGAAAALDVVVRSNGPRAEDARRLRDALASLPVR